MRTAEIRALAEQAGIAEGVRVLDLCCGIAGPGRYLVRTFGCRYLGVDRDPGAIEVARQRARGLPCEFRVQEVPPVPAGPFGVVLLLETMLAFEDKQALVREVAGALEPGGRFAFTLEAGAPLTDRERERMPDAGSVWPAPLETMRELLAAAGLGIHREQDLTASHCETAASLLRSYEAARDAISAEIGTAATAGLLTAHRRWVDWLASGRVRKLAVVAERSGLA